MFQALSGVCRPAAWRFWLDHGFRPAAFARLQLDAIAPVLPVDFMSNCSGVSSRAARTRSNVSIAQRSPSCRAPCKTAVKRRRAEACASRPTAPPRLLLRPRPRRRPAQSSSAPPATQRPRPKPREQLSPCRRPARSTTSSRTVPGSPAANRNSVCLKANAAHLSPNCQAAVRRCRPLTRRCDARR